MAQRQPNPAPAAFALAPAMVNPDQPIDYSTSEGIKIFQKATRSLYSDDKEAFDCTPDGLLDFLQLVKDRSLMMNYEVIFKIPDKSVEPSVTRDFLNNYGALRVKDIKENVETYINQESRLAQESFQIYHALMNSLSTSGRAKVTAWEDEYTVNGLKSGVLLLKKIISVSMIDTNATSSHIRTQLASLDAYIGNVDSDISKFNQHVKSLVNQLHMRRETTTDLLTNLFKGYIAAADKQFVEYIKKKKDEYEEGTDMSTDRLMILAENKFKILSQNGEWRAPTPEQEQILALEAKVKEQSEAMRRYRGNKSKDGNNKNNGKKGKKSEKKGKPKWMSKGPKTGDPKTKSVDNKEYHWCHHHSQWVRHKPSDCNLQQQGKNKIGKSGDQPKSSKTVRFAQSLSAVADDLDEE